MLIKVTDDIWFDNEKMYVIKGEYNRYMYEKNEGDFPNHNLKKKKSEYPTVIFLSSTECNLKCRYCYADEGTYSHVSQKRALTFADYTKIFDMSLKKYGKVKALSFFGGEPLLNFIEIKKFVEYLHSNYTSEYIPHMSILSNGTIMNDEIANFIKKYNFAYGTSLDGPKDLNDNCRIGDNILSVHDEVINSLDVLKDSSVKKALQFTLNKTHLQNYKDGDIVKWVEHIEKTGVEGYEIVGVTTDIPDLKIDLTDADIFNSYTKLCEELSDHCLGMLKSSSSLIMPKFFAGILLHIMKREYQNDCNAGFSFAVSPDLMVYPCHVSADDKKNGIHFDKYINEELDRSSIYSQISDIKRSDFKKCDKCIARNMCPYICKSLIHKNHGNLLDERCEMMKVFSKKSIEFLVNEYPVNKEIIDQNLRDITLLRVFK